MSLLYKNQENRQKPWLLLFWILFICITVVFWHTNKEKTFYYWDFGAYQQDLNTILRAHQLGFNNYLTSIWTIQNSEYPLNWAFPILVLPFSFLSSRFFYVLYICTVGFSLLVFGIRNLISTLFPSWRLNNKIAVIILFSPGAWMIAIRGWPDLIAIGFIWYGFSKTFCESTSIKFLGAFLILNGIIMRKTTLLLGVVLLFVSIIVNLVFYVKSNTKFGQQIKDIKYLLLFIVASTILISITPGFVKMFTGRNNENFYDPFQVGSQEYFNNLIAMNGAIAIILSLIAIISLFVFSRQENSLVFLALALVPIVYTTLWIKVFSQATDHHMVQWVPIYSTLGVIFLLRIFSEGRIYKYLKTFLFLLLISNLMIPLTLEVTPLASSSNGIIRPFAHSFSPIERTDRNSIKNLIDSVSESNIGERKSIAVLIDSHEFNSGIVNLLISEDLRHELQVFSIGSLDFRDDPGINRILNADYILAAKPFIAIIPKYQQLLKLENDSIITLSAVKESYWEEIERSTVGVKWHSHLWWSNVYEKSLTEILVFRRVKKPTVELALTFADKIGLGETNDRFTKSGVYAIYSSPDSNSSSSMNGNQATIVLNRKFPRTVIYTKAEKLKITSKCDFLFEENLYKKNAKNYIAVNGAKNSFLFNIRINSKNQLPCSLNISENRIHS